MLIFAGQNAKPFKTLMIQMNQKLYFRLNNLFGWLVFSIAACTYLLTVEPSISLWDCPEYVTCAAKGEVGHPPGNTFFLLAGRFFANFAGGDMTQVALWINRMSALFSAGTILLLFWTITSLTSRLLVRDETGYTWSKVITLLSCGLIGSLVYTWSDTFWFSAVEAEVYAFSSFMTALTFWLVLKWERRADDPSSDRYLLLIAYVVGLSIGVHLLNLLCLPAIVLICYFRRCHKTRPLGICLALVGSMALIALILYGFIPLVVWLAKQVELLMVNGLGFAFNTGTLLSFFLLLCTVLSLLVAVCRGRLVAPSRRRLAYNVLFSIFMLLVGYSTFAQILIRSSASLPMNENAPDNIFAFSSYLNREQYGQSPLLYGQTFASAPLRDKAEGKGKPLYAKQVKTQDDQPDQYYVYDHVTDYEYDYTMLFPRMYSDQPQHVAGYKQWCDYQGQQIQVKGAQGRTRSIRVPTMGENLIYFVRYQLNHMYWRYFFWNFCGRQNDLCGNGEADRGNWITGITWIDTLLVGNQEEMPDCIVRNKAHNVYYMLPLLLGLLGLCWQWRRGEAGRQGWLIVTMLFLMTGIAIVVYLNQTPYQPRERDYAYAGSFYAFSIWVGMGVAAVAGLLAKIAPSTGRARPILLPVLSAVLCLSIPLQMMGQNWDDHDRSDRYIAHDFGQNYLSSLEQDAIIFTNGDNDTFPLWYAIEVEGFRPDVRVCNLAYLQTDWYIDQMKSPAYESAPLPIPFGREEYAGRNLLATWAEDYQIPVDAEAVRRSEVIHLQEGDSILSSLDIHEEGKRYRYRNEIMQHAILQSVARDGWRRPLYFAVSVGPDVYAGMEPYFRTSGMAYQVVPLASGGQESIDVDWTFDCLMHRFKWGNANKTGLYLDEFSLNMCATHRMIFARLIEALLQRGDTSRALQAALYSQQVLPTFNVPADLSTISIARALYYGGKGEEALSAVEELLSQTDRYLHWVFSLDPARRQSCHSTLRRQLLVMRYALQEIARWPSASDLTDQYINSFSDYYAQYSQLNKKQ